MASCSRVLESACKVRRRSRLASIYSGETGFDIYTRAVSDVYQDLYGEGIFAGKGIYEVDTVRQVLDRRFPRNAFSVTISSKAPMRARAWPATLK